MQTELTDDALWVLASSIHDNVSEDKRPMSWSDFSPEQIERLRRAALKFLAALQPSTSEALDRLFEIARHDTGQSRRVANFLLSWWNAGRDGGFDLTDLWNVDTGIADDMVTVFRMVAQNRSYPDSLGYDFSELVTLWRKSKRRRKLASDE